MGSDRGAGRPEPRVPRSTRARAPGSRRPPRRVAASVPPRRPRAGRSRSTAGGAWCVRGDPDRQLRPETALRRLRTRRTRRPSARGRPAPRAARPPTLRREGPGAHALGGHRVLLSPAHSRAHLWEHYGAAPRNRRTLHRLECRGVTASGVSPQVTRPCFASSTSLAWGASATASATSFESAKPGLMYGIQTASEPKHSCASRSPPTRAHDRADRVRVRVVDMRRGHERVQERLDRRPRHAGRDLAARQILHHLLVRHRVALAQRQRSRRVGDR